MTPKQAERLRLKISDIRRTLGSEKRRFGWYDDSRGLRYLPTSYLIKLEDYKGGRTYLRWFSRNFPDDAGFPDFLFEWTIILFKCGKAREAKKAFECFCSNTYLIDQFFGIPLRPLNKWEGSSLAGPEFAAQLKYSSIQPELEDFSIWLEGLTGSDEFTTRCNRYVDLQKQLKVAEDPETRRTLILEAAQLIENT